MTDTYITLGPAYTAELATWLRTDAQTDTRILSIDVLLECVLDYGYLICFYVFFAELIKGAPFVSSCGII